MALTINPFVRFRQEYGMRRGLVKITFDNSYPTGGWAFGPTDVGLTKFNLVDLPSVTDTGYLMAYDYTNGKIKIFAETGAAGALSELAASSAALNGVEIRLMYTGY